MVYSIIGFQTEFKQCMNQTKANLGNAVAKQQTDSQTRKKLQSVLILDT
jgi:hypothetical protein